MGGYSPTATNYLVSEVKYLGPAVLMVLISRRYSSPGHAPRPGAPTGILPYTWRSHWDPPLESTFPPGSSPTLGAPSGILPWTQRSNQDPSLGPTLPPGSSRSSNAPWDPPLNPTLHTRILSLYKERTRFPTLPAEISFRHGF